MQTFLSEHGLFSASAAVLDNSRLNKQLLEGRQIMSALAGESKGWTNHPATKMWNDSEVVLYTYLEDIALELESRNIQFTKNMDVIHATFKRNWSYQVIEERIPRWWADDDERNKLVFSHRANLHSKDPDHYRQYEREANHFYTTLASDPLSVVCCATRRAGKPCGYYWPTH